MAPSSSASPALRLGVTSIADVVFGLALSIGSLALIAHFPQTGAELGDEVVEFGFSFFIVITAWLAYRRIVVVLPHETPATLGVSLALMFTISVEPFLFYVFVSTTTITDAASAAFALDVGAMLVLLSSLTFLLLREETASSGASGRPKWVVRAKRSMWGRLGSAALFLVSAAPGLWTISFAGLPLRTDFWWVGLLSIIVWQRGAVLAGSGPMPRP